ncbi:germinal-center associated nuclear protein isoform X2 [Gambusia affinis]|uniref:germinal-center associated nuclear protein isoform X2 n=1 Tax=Gambusia affinis TaxID=33528 RepID=UPI001CDD86AF|nr:germinal-center associated nuclear protein isoform X2 [Gambusia affinis]
MNPFGSPQGGAFQAPSSSMKPGLFQGFGQQNPSGSQGQSFLQPPAFGQQSAAFQPAVQSGSMFGQRSVVNQPAPQGGSIFGQPSVVSQPGGQGGYVFGQSSNPPAGQSGNIFGQPSNQSPAQGNSIFGQPSNQSPAQGNSIFGQPSNQSPAQGNSIFGQPSNQPTAQSASMFGQASAVNQPSAQSGSVFGQHSAGNQPSGLSGSIFGQTSAVNQPSAPSGSIFGQTSVVNQLGAQSGSIFGQPTMTNQPAAQVGSVFGQQSVVNQPEPQSGSIFGQPSTANQSATQSGSIFGQPSTANQPATQSGSIFGQPSTANQPATQSGSIFGQPSTANQPATQSGSIFGQLPAQAQPPMSKAPAFGQPPVETSSSAVAFGLNQSSVFGQSPSFVQPSAFGQHSDLGKAPPAFGSHLKPSGSTASNPSFVQPASSEFSAPQNVNQNRGFGPPEFSFKPPNEAVFKPIFSGSPEPPSSRAPAPSGPSAGFSLLVGTKPPVFSCFPQPAAPPPGPNPPSGGGSGGPQFSFTNPAAPPGPSSTAEPTTPSSFSFTSSSLQTQPMLFPPAFGDPKSEFDPEDKEAPEPSVFTRLSKAAKRKDDLAASGPEKPGGEDDAPTPPDADSPRPPAKRPVVRARGIAAGLFSRALSGIRKDQSNPVRREAPKEPPRPPAALGPPAGGPSLVLEEPEEAQRDEPPAKTLTALSRDTAEKPEDSGPSDPLTSASEPLTPVGRGPRRDSVDSLSGASPSDLTTIVVRNVPPSLNKKDVIQKHFARFGKVGRIFCRPNKNQAVVHFHDHASAVKAKRRGMVLHRHELLLLWQKKKQSPGDKGSRAPAEPDRTAAESPKVDEPKPGCSPLRRPALMPPAPGGHASFRQSSPVRRPSPARLLPFDSEPQKENVSESQGSERLVPSSLVHLVGQVAETAEDKYRLLEQRDKVLRQGRPKRTDLDLSKVFVGTCPDMCPEKERYMRETRNQLSVYEVVPNTEVVDHAAAIKEYSRSSADQEEPLPHELRPLPVLSMTMDYLVTQILDRGPDSHRDWYDFVWNRTRGIRKDITQQRLCCPHTVSLIEKCTRFHVHCAHHLCEQHMSSFDPKINNENMTKCLQSLKEMYEDLATQQTFCPLEAEFRQYSVLLKLNDGDILREVQRFRHEVRKSPEVRFAVQAFAAVSSNNFVRFFKLVKGASYLSSCLLHRYFNQVRSKALKALIAAHTFGSRSTPFPVDDIVRMLMFRSASEATDFVQQYGLNVNDGLVELSRIVFQEPELPLSLKRSEVILSKKAPLIGEVVNGGPVPDPPQHRPVCSFDSHNRYRGDGLLAEPGFGYVNPRGAAAAQTADSVEVSSPPRVEAPPPPIVVPDAPAETGEPFPPAAPTFPPVALPEPAKPPSPPPKPQPLYSEEDVLAAAESLLEEVVEAEVRALADGGASIARAALRESEAQLEVLVQEVLEQMMTEVSASEIRLEQERLAEERRRLEEARRRQERQAFLAQFSCSLCSEVVQQVVAEVVRETAAAEIQEAVDEEAERLARCSHEVCSSLIEETLAADVAQLAEDVLEAQLERIHKFIKRWSDVVAVRRQLKRQMRSFPAAPCCVDPRFKLRALAPSAPQRPSMADLARGLVDLGNAGMLAVSSTRLLQMRRGAVHQMRVQSFYQQLLEETCWKPLDLPALATENVPNPTDRIFWKVLLLLPSEREAGPADRILSDWLEVKLGADSDSEEQRDGTLRTLCVSNSLQDNEHRTHKVHITVKASRGPLTDAGLSGAEERCELRGAAAIMMLLPLLQAEQAEQDVPLLSALLQLKQLQQISSWSCPLPLVVLVPWQRGAADAERLEEALRLQALMEEELISDFLLVFIPESTSDLQGSQQLTQAVRWLLARRPLTPPLSCRPLVQLVEAALSREFCPRVYSDRQNRAAAGLPRQGPAPAVRLYNAVLAHVADGVASPELSCLSWPPAEFSEPETREVVPHLGWNSAPQLDWLRAALLGLQLPEWEELPAADSWPDLCAAIFRYAAHVPTSRHSQPLLMSRLENLLERVRLTPPLARRHRPGPTQGGVGPGAACSPIPWDDVVLIFIDHKLKDWQPAGPPAAPDSLTADGEVLVFFPSGSLDGFRPPAEWVLAVDRTHRETQQEEEEGWAPGPSALRSAPALRQKLFHSRVEAPDSPDAPGAPDAPDSPGAPGAPPPCLDITHTPSTEELLAHRVLQNLEEEKAESRRSLEQLQRWLDGDPLDHLVTPLFIPSSTLLSSPSTMRVSAPAAAAQKPETEERVDGASWAAGSGSSRSGSSRSGSSGSAAPPVPLAQRLQELQQQIVASREEERACRLKLSSLLSIVDD